MRNLIISRKKRFVACLGKLKIMIADPFSGDVDINGVMTRKIGELKNGETGTFAIGEEATEIYVIADGASKSFCVDMYPIEAGTEDVVLSGKNVLNPAAGNPFEFDNPPGATVEYRKAHRRATRAAWLILILGVVIGVVFFTVTLKVVLPKLTAQAEPAPRTFSVYGLDIELSDDYEASAQDDLLYSEKRDVAVTFLREDFSLEAGFGSLTLREYIEAVRETVDVDVIYMTTSKNTPCFRFVRNFDGVDWVYYAFAYKGTECFWLVQFFMPLEIERNVKSYVFERADSVSWKTEAASD